MGKVSFASKDMVEVGFGFERGKGKIVEIGAKYHQYPARKKDDANDPSKKAGDQSPPFLCVQVGLVHVNDSLEVIDDEVKYVELGIMTTNQRGGAPPFSVGQAKSSADENPVDLLDGQGPNMEVIGNCIFAREDGVGINKKTPWGRFSDSLEHKGFKAEVLGNGYLPDLVGTVAEFGNTPLERWPGYTGKEDPKAFVCLNTPIVLPYQQQKGAGAAAGAGAGAGKKSGGAGAGATAKPAATAQAQTTTATTGTVVAGAPDLQAIAISAANLVVADVKGKDLDIKTFRGKIQQKLLKMEVKPPTIHPKVIELFKSDESLATIGAECGFMVNEDGGIVWPE